MAVSCSNNGEPGPTASAEETPVGSGAAGSGNAAGQAAVASGATAGSGAAGSGTGGAGSPSGGGGAENIGGAGSPSGGGAENLGGAGSPSGGAETAGVAGGAVTNGGSSANGGGPAGGTASAGVPPSGGAAGASSAGYNDTLPTFTSHTIADFPGGYAVFCADIDGDGLPDVVALSATSEGLVWFQNPSWTRYTITTEAQQLLYAAPYDVDGDGDLDVAFISDFSVNNTTSGGTISWAEAPDDPTLDQQWQLHAIGAIPSSHRVAWADIDGDGRKELIDLPIFGVGSSAPAYAGAVELTAYSIPEDLSGSWMSSVLDDQHLEVAHAIQIVDWDGDGTDDILTAANDGVDLFRPSLSAEPLHVAAGQEGEAPSRGSSEVVLGYLGDQRFMATIEPWHGTDTVIYTPGASESDLWTRQALGPDFEHGHGMVIADLNRDGYDEVIGGGGQGAMTQLIYRYVPSSGSWDKIELDVGGVAVSGMYAEDLNGDGAIDIVSIGTSPTNNVVWYESSG